MKDVSKAAKIRVIISIVAISFIQGLQYCCSPVLGAVSEHYPDVGVSFVQMLVTAPTFLSIIVALTSGWLVLKISKKKMLVFAGFVAGITGFLPFLADSFWLLFACRVVYGVGLGLATALNTAVVAEFFEGDERVTVMGIQAASVGAGMTVVTTGSGILGNYGFRTAYFINIIGFLCMLLIGMLLPETGVAEAAGEKTKIRLTPEVWKLTFMIGVECLFLIAFNTNIGMHLGGELAGNAGATGNLTGVFSASQILMGVILGYVTKRTGKYTLSAAYLSFAIGAVFLVLFPSNLFLLMIGAVFCGFSQGMFIPTAMVGASNAVEPVATAMASAVLTCGMCFGQLISPTVLNTVSKVIFGEVSTSHVYMICIVGMTAAAVISGVLEKR